MSVFMIDFASQPASLRCATTVIVGMATVLLLLPMGAQAGIVNVYDRSSDTYSIQNYIYRYNSASPHGNGYTANVLRYSFNPLVLVYGNTFSRPRVERVGDVVYKSGAYEALGYHTDFYYSAQ